MKSNKNNNYNQNDETIDFSVKTQLILLTQQQKQSNILLQLSVFPLKLLQKALNIDEKQFLNSLDEDSKKYVLKSQKFFKYQTLAFLSQQELYKVIKKDCKSSFNCWKFAQFVTYFNLQASRIQQLNVEQQLEKISEAENVLSPSNIGENFLEEINYKILKLMFILEKIRVWVQMGDFIKSVKTFLVNESYLQTFNIYEGLMDKVETKQEDKRKFQWILLIKSYIYLTYAFAMQKVQEYSKCINAYEIYLRIKEKILQVDFVNELFKQGEKQNAYYSLYIYFFYKYCKALIKDKQDEKALQSVYKAEYALNQFQIHNQLKLEDINSFKKKFQLLSSKIQELLKNRVINKIHQQNEFLYLQPPKYQDEQLKQIKLFFKISKQNDIEQQQQQQQQGLNKTKSEGDLSQNDKSDLSNIETKNNIPAQDQQKDTLFANSSEKPQISFLGSYLDILDSFLGDDQHDEKILDIENKLKTDEEEQVEEKFEKIIEKKEIDIKGLTDKQTPKTMTPLNILLAQNEIVMDNFFNVKRFHTEYASNNRFKTEPKYQQHQSDQKIQEGIFNKLDLMRMNKKDRQIFQNNDLKQDTSPTTRLMMNFSGMNTTSNQNTQLDSRRVSQLHSERFRNNSLLSQNSQIFTTNYSRELKRKGSLNRWSMHQPNSLPTQPSQFYTQQTNEDRYNNRNQEILHKRQRNMSVKLNQLTEIEDYSKTTRNERKESFHNQYKNKYQSVYAEAFNSGSQTDRPRSSSNHIRIQTLKRAPSISQKGTQRIRSTKNRDQDDQNILKSKSPSSRTKTNYELIKDFDIEFELQYLLGKNSNFTEQNEKFGQKAELIKRPYTEQDEYQGQFRQNTFHKYDNSVDSNTSNYKIVNQNIPNIINFLQESKRNFQLENLPQKYFNLAQTDQFMRKKLNSITLDNVLGFRNKNKIDVAQSDLMMQINQRNHFVTGLQKFPEDQRNHIIKFGGVVYNQSKQDFELMDADKYGKGYMNQDLEEKMKSVKEELKKIEFIPPKPPTSVKLSTETESEILNISNVDLISQKSAIVQRFKQNLKIEMDAINETNLFVNHELSQTLSNKSQGTYRSQYKSQFQRYANKDFYVNQIAQHNVTIHRGDQEENFTNALQNQEKKDSQSEQEEEIEEQYEEIEQENEKYSNQDEKRISLSDYSYSLADNLSEANKTVYSSSIINQQAFSMNKVGGSTPRASSNHRQSVFKLRHQSTIQNYSQNQENNIFTPIVQNVIPSKSSDNKDDSNSDSKISSNQSLSNQHIPQQASRFQQFTLERKLSLFIGDKQQEQNVENNQKQLSSPTEVSEKSSQQLSPETPNQMFDDSKNSAYLNLYENLDKDSLKEDKGSFRVINKQKLQFRHSEPFSQQFIQQNNNQHKREQYQRKQQQKHYTIAENSPSRNIYNGASPKYRKLSTKLILFSKEQEELKSPGSSPFSLQKVFLKFQKNEKNDSIQGDQIIESPTKLPTDLNIQIHFDENLVDNPLNRSRKLSEGENRSQSNSFNYQKNQFNNKGSLFKLKLQNVQINQDSVVEEEQFQIEDNLPMQQESNKKEYFQYEQTSIALINEIEGESQIKSCLKIQKCFRRYQQQKKLLEERINKNKFKRKLAPKQNDNNLRDTQREKKQNDSVVYKTPRKNTIFKRDSCQENFQPIPDIGLRNLISARLFQQKIRESQSGLINNQSPFHKLYPPFKFTRLIQGVPVLWKVKHQLKKEVIANNEINSYFLTIVYGNNRFSIQVDLDYAGMQLRGLEYETLWPLYLVAFEKFLRDQNIKIYIAKPQNDVKNLPYPLSFFEGLTSKLKSKITDFDLNCVGNLKDLLEIYLKHFFEFELKVNGLVLEYNKNQIFPQWKLISVKKAQKKLDRFISMSVEGKKTFKEDYKQNKREYELALQQNERVLQNNLVRFIKENHLLGVFIKRSTGGYYYLIVVKVNFRQSNDISTQIVNGQLMLSDFSFYITGRNLGTYQTILPLEVHASQVMKYFKTNTLIREINKDIMEIKRRIQKESQKQVLLQNPFNDFFLIEQMKRNKSSAKEVQNTEQKGQKYEQLVEDNFNHIYKTFYKTQLEDNFEKDNYSMIQEDDELDKKYEDGYYQTHEEILRAPPQEEIIEQQQQQQQLIEQQFQESQKQVKQGNQLRRKNNIFVINSQLDLQQQLEGFWRLSNLFGNGRCLSQKVFFCTQGAHLWIRIQMNILKGIMVAQISDYSRGVSFAQIIKNQKVRQNLINMSTLVPEQQSNLCQKQIEILKQIAFQGILELEKSLLGQRIRIKVQREEDTLKNPVILKNKDSIKNHLLIDSVELKKHYDFDEYTSILTHNQLGKIICIIKTFIINKAIDQSLINTYLFRITIQAYQSKHYQFKIILGFDDLLQIDKQLYNNLLKQYNKIYAQKLISLIMSRLQLVGTIQGKVPCFLNSSENKLNDRKAIKIEDDASTTPRKLEQNNLGQSCLRFKRNRFTKQSYNQQNMQQQKTMLDDYLQQSRIIFQGIKKFSGEFCIVTVSKDILLRYWVFNIYVPKTCRVLVSYFNNSDMMDCSEEFLSKQMSQKIIYFFENPQMTPFKCYRDFIKRIGLENGQQENEQINHKPRKKKVENKSLEQNNNPTKSKNLIDLRLEIIQNKATDENKSKKSTPNQSQNSTPNKNKSSGKQVSMKESQSKKGEEQMREMSNRKNIGKRKSVLDLKFEFSNFQEKFNNLRQVFEPGIQKKKSISSDSSSQSSNSLFSQNLSPVQFKGSKTKKQNVFQFNFQKVEQKDNSNNQQNKKVKQFQRSGTHSIIKNSNFNILSQEKPIQSLQSRRKLVSELKTQEHIGIPNSELRINTSSVANLSSLNLQKQSQRKGDLEYFPYLQQINNRRSVDRRQSAVIIYGQRQQIDNKDSLQQFNNKQLELELSSFKQSILNNKQRQITQQKVTVSSQKLNQQQESSKSIEFSPYPRLNLQKKDNKSDRPDNKSIEEGISNRYQSSSIIQQNQKIVNQLFSYNEGKRASLLSNSRQMKQDIKSLYMNILKSKPVTQTNKDDLTSITTSKSIKLTSNKQIKLKNIPKEKRGLQYYIKKHFIKLLVVIHIKQYIDMKRVGNKVKIERTQKFFDLTKVLDDAFTQQEHTVRIQNLCKFIEIRLWENLIAQSRLEADLQCGHMLFCFENSKLPLHELMFHDFMQIEGNTNHEFNTEICINFIDIVSNKGLSCKHFILQNKNLDSIINTFLKLTISIVFNQFNLSKNLKIDQKYLNN